MSKKVTPQLPLPAHDQPETKSPCVTAEPKETIDIPSKSLGKQGAVTFPRAFHFIGIGGIGMSGLATIVLEKGSSQVSGSDLREGGCVDSLKGLGAHVVQGHDKGYLPHAATVVISTDIPLDNPELVEAKRRSQPVIHRSDLLADLMHGYEVLVVTGTHGKTTTTSLLSHVLFEAGQDPSFAVGGVLLNYGCNARHGKGAYFVAEADESDGTFLKYLYASAIITNIDTDHIAHFGSLENLEKAFSQFIKKAPLPERLFFCGDDERLRKLCPRGVSYGTGPANDLRIEHVHATEQGMVFDVRFRRRLFRSICLPLHGHHNVANAAAVFGLALTIGIPEASIRAAFVTFKGVKRRLERKESGSQCFVFDDYAHHPTEIKATIHALRHAIGERRLIAVFQPHRPSRMKHCMKELVTAFKDADAIVVTDIYLSNEHDNPEITNDKIFGLIKESHQGIPCSSFQRSSLVDSLFNIVRPHDVVLFLGAGDITKASDDFANRLATTALEKWKVGIVYGGMNSENKISRVSASAVYDSLDTSLYTPIAFEIDQRGHWHRTQGIERDEQSHDSTETFSKGVWQALQSCDLFIPVLRGAFGEDGTIQGFFEILHKPYVGCPTKACAVSMDKVMAKQVVQAAGVPVVPYVVFHRRDWKDHSQELLADAIKKLRPPYFVKPAHLGSSIGIERIEKSADLAHAIDVALALDDKILVEQGVKGREIEFAVFGNEQIIVPPPGEVLTGGGFYDYKAKYGKDGMKSIPTAHLTEEQIEQGRVYIKKAYQALDCSGLSRMDCFLDDDGHWYFNEANPFPVFARTSVYPSVWKGQGITYSELVNRLIILSLSRFRQARRLANNAIALGREMERMCVV
jgi:UDP-N-acetylmuramate--alanine ligase